jgi:hypothetical protein
MPQASEYDIKQAFLGGDDDGDNTLSVYEASTALEKLSGKYISSSTVESACDKAGISTSREMDCELSPTVKNYLCLC